MDTELGKVLTYCERFLTLKLLDPSLVKIYISTFARPMNTKFGSVFNFERRFRTQTLKYSPTLRFQFFLHFLL